MLWGGQEGARFRGTRGGQGTRDQNGDLNNQGAALAWWVEAKYGLGRGSRLKTWEIGLDCGHSQAFPPDLSTPQAALPLCCLNCSCSFQGGVCGWHPSSPLQWAHSPPLPEGVVPGVACPTTTHTPQHTLPRPHTPSSQQSPLLNTCTLLCNSLSIPCLTLSCLTLGPPGDPLRSERSGAKSGTLGDREQGGRGEGRRNTGRVGRGLKTYTCGNKGGGTPRANYP